MPRSIRVLLLLGAAAAAVAPAAVLLETTARDESDPMPRPVAAADAGPPPAGQDGGGPARAGLGARPAGPGSGAAADADAAPYEPDEVLVANAPTEFRTKAGAMGYRVVETLLLHRLGDRVYRVRLPAGTDVPTAIARLRARFPQAVVDANHHYERSAGASMPASHARALAGWTDLPDDCGGGVRLGMIDAGIDVGHPALSGARLTYRAFHRDGRDPGPAEHGTAVAALMVGQLAAGRGWGGLAPGATLYAANIFEITEAGRSVATARGLLSAFDWIAGRDVHVLNLSIAGPDNKVVRRVVSKARRLNLAMVAAAGNWGTESRPAYPAAYDEVIAVTAVGADRRIYAFANRGAYVDFAAPGVHLWTAVPDGGRYQSGTSFASPFVSVVVGAAIAAGAAAGPDDIREHLRGGVVDLGPPGRDTVYGWGLVTAPPACRGAPARTTSLALGARR